MFTSRKIMIACAAACMIIAMPACKKSTNVNAVTQNVENSTQCTSENFNSLISFVPEDSPFVLASTQNIDLNHAIYQTLRDHSGKYLASVEKFLERSAKPFYTFEEFIDKVNYAVPDRRQEVIVEQLYYSPDEKSKIEIEKSIEYIKELEGLMKDYKAKAPEFGLNPDHIDQILYLDGSSLVYKQTLEDGTKLKSKLDTLFQNIPFKAQLKYKEIKAEDETWSVFSFVPEGLIELEKLKRLQNELIKNTSPEAVKAYKEKNNHGVGTLTAENVAKSIDEIVEVQKLFLETISSDIKNIDEKSLSIAGGNDGFPYNLRIAVHFGQNTLTAVLLTDESQLATCNRVLKPATKPLNRSGFCPTQPNSMMIGFLDNIKGFDNFLKSDIRKEIDKALGIQASPECDKEFSEIIADYPSLSFNARVDGSNKITADSVLVFKDKEFLKKVQDLHAQSIDLFSDKTVLGLKLNIDLGKLLKLVIAQATVFSKNEYKCTFLSQIASESQNLPQIINSPDFASIKKIFDSITGINAAFDKISVDENHKHFDIEGTINATGPDFASVSSDLIPIIRSVDRSIAREISKNDALVVGADPVEVHVDDWKFNAMLTQTDLIAATPQYDVKSISSRARTNQPTFFEFKLADRVLSELIIFAYENETKYTSTPDTVNQLSFMKDIAELQKDMIRTISVGTNDEGIVSTGTIEF